MWTHPQDRATLDLNLKPLVGPACREAEAGGFWAYAAGTAHKVATEHEIGGIQLDNYLTTLPLKKGLSSSAAICVMVGIRAPDGLGPKP